jgi:hypothetical protein
MISKDTSGIQIDVFPKYDTTNIKFEHECRTLNLYKTARQLGFRVGASIQMAPLICTGWSYMARLPLPSLHDDGLHRSCYSVQTSRGDVYGQPKNSARQAYSEIWCFQYEFLGLPFLRL